MESSNVGDDVPFLSIVTVVFNDWAGLQRTLNSVAPHRSDDIEHWIIDGSTDGQVRGALEQNRPPRTYLLSEPDDGLYDAMNKGLDRSQGTYVLFLNAGDQLHEDFSLEAARGIADGKEQVLVGYSVERWGNDGYLRPGRGREVDALQMPPHQATFYPRSYYRNHSYDLNRPIGADGAYTVRAVRSCGATFIPILVCQFELGGRSTRYDLAAIRARFHEYRRVRSRAQVLAKGALWVALSQRWFYRLMAWRKFTRVSETSIELIEKPIVLAKRALD